MPDSTQKTQRIFNRFVKVTQELLHTSPVAQKAKQYLDSRLAEEHQKTYEFGFFPDDDNLHILTKMFPKEQLDELGFCYPKFVAGGLAPHGHFAQHNLIMPFRDVHGNVISILGRCLIDEAEREEIGLQKYKYSIGSKKDFFVYGLDKAKQHIIEKNVVIGVEGQFDCISLHVAGVRNVVAFGWANVSRYQMFQLHRYTNNIILMFDSDEAGKKAKSRVKTRYKDIANIKTISQPKGYKDIDQFLRTSTDEVDRNSVIERLKSF